MKDQDITEDPIVGWALVVVRWLLVVAEAIALRLQQGQNTYDH